MRAWTRASATIAMRQDTCHVTAQMLTDARLTEVQSSASGEPQYTYTSPHCFAASAPLPLQVYRDSNDTYFCPSIRSCEGTWHQQMSSF